MAAAWVELPIGGDRLVGKDGADMFRYLGVANSHAVMVEGVNRLDQIVAFTQGRGQDRSLAINTIDALAGDQAFVFIADPVHYRGSWTGVV
jgi:hypothetical protein